MSASGSDWERQKTGTKKLLDNKSHFFSDVLWDTFLLQQLSLESVNFTSEHPLCIASSAIDTQMMILIVHTAYEGLAAISQSDRRVIRINLVSFFCTEHLHYHTITQARTQPGRAFDQTSLRMGVVLELTRWWAEVLKCSLQIAKFKVVHVFLFTSFNSRMRVALRRGCTMSSSADLATGSTSYDITAAIYFSEK